MMRRKAQFAIEFIILISFMFLVFLVFMSIISSKILEAKENERQQIAEDIAGLVKNEVQLAKSISNGYSRNFDVPNKIKGMDYDLEIIENRELVVNYIDKEYVSFLPEKVCGDVFIPNNEISKEEGIVCLNSNLDQTQCQNAQDIGLCDEIDRELMPGAKCCCQQRYGLCPTIECTPSPEILEICDNIDNNCDGVRDEGCDDDFDNYCDASIELVGTPNTCTAGGNDCNDEDEDINPGSGAVCNYDEECNVPSDDDTCGTISCSGWYVQEGTENTTTTETCYNKADITSNRCKAYNDCKDTNSADCDAQANNIEQYSCGTCEYIDSNSCTGTTLGTCSNYDAGTPCGGDNQCDGNGNCACVPVHGEWSDWTTTATCSATCGGGTFKRTRTCNNPAPNSCGNACVGDDFDWNGGSCDAGSNVCGWSDYGDYGSCSVSCGTGTRSQTRSCSTGAAGSAHCSGSATNTENCNTQPCCTALEGSCSDGGECCSGNCYVDADGDGYAPSGGSKTCRASAPTYSGTDCDDSCGSCYPGSTAATSNPDGRDQDCSGGTDNAVDVTYNCPYWGNINAENLDSTCNSICGVGGGVMTCNHREARNHHSTSYQYARNQWTWTSCTSTDQYSQHSYVGTICRSPPTWHEDYPQTPWQKCVCATKYY